MKIIHDIWLLGVGIMKIAVEAGDEKRNERKLLGNAVA